MNYKSYMGVYTLLGILTGGLAIFLLNLRMFESGFQFIPGITFVLLLLLALYQAGISRPLNLIVVVLASMLGYYAAVWTALLISSDRYLLGMALAGLVGAIILALGFRFVKLIPDIKYFFVLASLSIVASVLTPQDAGAPNMNILFPLWQGLVGMYVGYLVYRRNFDR